MPRNVRATLFMTLDGVVESPEKGSFPYWGDDIAKFKDDELRETDALLLGRKTYEGFAAAWPGRTDKEGFAQKFNSMPKYVASTTMKKAEWQNSHVLKGELRSEVTRLKKDSGEGDIMVHGSPTLIRSLLQEDLLDELRLLV